MLENIAQQIQQVNEVANTPGVKESLEKPDLFSILCAMIVLPVVVYGWYKAFRYGGLGEEIRSILKKKQRYSVDELRDLYTKRHVWIRETVWDPKQSTYRIV